MLALGATALIVASALPILAHHAFEAQFDPIRPLVLKGPVVRVEWVNPHTWIDLEATTDSGDKEVSMVEGGTLNSLLRRGLKQDTIKIGQVIVVDGVPSQGSLESGQRAGRDLRGQPEVPPRIVQHGSTVRYGEARPIAWRHRHRQATLLSDQRRSHWERAAESVNGSLHP